MSRYDGISATALQEATDAATPSELTSIRSLIDDINWADARDTGVPYAERPRISNDQIEAWLLTTTDANRSAVAETIADLDTIREHNGEAPLLGYDHQVAAPPEPRNELVSLKTPDSPPRVVNVMGGRNSVTSFIDSLPNNVTASRFTAAADAGNAIDDAMAAVYRGNTPEVSL